MRYRHSITHCLHEAATQSRLDGLLARLRPAVAALKAGSNKAAAPILDLASRSDDLAEIETLAADLRARFSTIVVAGSGGSGLSGRTLTGLILPAPDRDFHFLENIDPDLMDGVLARIDVQHSCFLVISKSGSTAETLSQFYVLFDHVTQALGADEAAKRFTVITIAADSPLRREAAKHNIRTLEHESDVGGRFSILSKVGLLPAAIAGLDIRALRRGAQEVVAQLGEDCPPALGAALQVDFMQRAHPMSVMLPYGERLCVFTLWYRQCWAESLGKLGKGSTPIPAIGTTDQHSQLQLYLDGPKDKLFTMLLLDRAGTGRPIPSPQVDYLQGKTLGDVMAAEQEATLATLVQKRCPVRVIRIPTLDEASMGALLMHFMIEIILAAALLEVDPFDQPAVEDGKILARDALLSGDLAGRL